VTGSWKQSPHGKSQLNLAHIGRRPLFRESLQGGIDALAAEDEMPKSAAAFRNRASVAILQLGIRSSFADRLTDCLDSKAK
jgi:hypothetical protein